MRNIDFLYLGKYLEVLFLVDFHLSNRLPDFINVFCTQTRWKHSSKTKFVHAGRVRTTSRQLSTHFYGALLFPPPWCDYTHHGICVLHTIQISTLSRNQRGHLKKINGSSAKIVTNVMTNVLTSSDIFQSAQRKMNRLDRKIVIWLATHSMLQWWMFSKYWIFFSKFTDLLIIECHVEIILYYFIVISRRPKSRIVVYVFWSTDHVNVECYYDQLEE